MGGVFLFLLGWQALVSTDVLQYEYLPAPSAIGTGLAQIVRTGDVFGELGHTLAVTLGGWLIATVIGVTVGAALGLSPRGRRYSLATVEVLRPLPAIAFVPAALLVFGFSIQMELAVIVLPAIWPALVNTMGGVASLSQRLYDITRSLRMSASDSILRVLLPAAAPAVLVGCRLSMTIALILAIGAEIIGNPMGLGYGLVREQQSMHPDLMFAYVLIIGLLGIALNMALVGVATAILPGEFRRRAATGDAR